MRDLELFEQYLVRLRQEKLEQGYQRALEATSNEEMLGVKAAACEAMLAQRMITALKLLGKDPGEFIRGYLK